MSEVLVSDSLYWVNDQDVYYDDTHQYQDATFFKDFGLTDTIGTVTTSNLVYEGGSSASTGSGIDPNDPFRTWLWS